MTLNDKYRPRAFDEVVGQKAVEVVRSYVRKKEGIPGLWLFYGPKGTGKTSTARVFALALNCQNLGEDQNPCLECTACKEILSGVQNDRLVEMDAASNRGIGDVRNIQKTLLWRHRGYKVVVMDEAHAMTTDAYNALLKTTEEPPKNVVFILVTTQADTIIGTVKDRAVQVKFDRLSNTVLNRHLTNLAKLEGIEGKLGSDAIDIIIKTADGSVRSLVKGLDVFVSLVAEGKDSDFARIYSAMEEENHLTDLVVSFLAKRANRFSEVVDKMKEDGMAPDDILIRLYSGCLTVALKTKGMKGIKGADDYPGAEISKDQYAWLSNKVTSWIPLLKVRPDYNLLVKLCMEFILFWS